jgi:hypothetical protein
MVQVLEGNQQLKVRKTTFSFLLPFEFFEARHEYGNSSCKPRDQLKFSAMCHMPLQISKLH